VDPGFRRDDNLLSLIKLVPRDDDSHQDRVLSEAQ